MVYNLKGRVFKWLNDQMIKVKNPYHKGYMYVEFLALKRPASVEIKLLLMNLTSFVIESADDLNEYVFVYL